MLSINRGGYFFCPPPKIFLKVTINVFLVMKDLFCSDGKRKRRKIGPAHLDGTIGALSKLKWVPNTILESY